MFRSNYFIILSKTPTIMKLFVLSVFALFFSFISKAQIKVITLEHSGTTSVYNNLDSAIAHAANGDDLYLSGGNFPFSGTIQKSLNIYGAGFFPDSTTATLPTIISSTSSFSTISISGSGASGLMLMGIMTPSSLTISGCSNILISRCHFGQSSSVNVQNASNISIKGSILNSVNAGTSITGTSTGTNLEIKNCITYGYIGASYAIIENSVLFSGTGSYYGLLLGISNSFLRNNIIYLLSATNSGNQNNSFYNNVFTDTVYSTGIPIFVNNLFNKSLSNIFQNAPYSVSHSYATDFHLKSGSPAIGAGVGGTDAGIYGGANPFKEGAVPLNPHVQKFSVPANTDQNGNLLINISVKAQNN